MGPVAFQKETFLRWSQALHPKVLIPGYNSFIVTYKDAGVKVGFPNLSKWFLLNIQAKP